MGRKPRHCHDTHKNFGKQTSKTLNYCRSSNRRQLWIVLQLNENGWFMKIKHEDFKTLKNHCHAVFRECVLSDLVEKYELGLFKNADKTTDLQKRFCFDVLYATKQHDFISELYQYLNDAHIYTALKVICPVISRKY